MTASQVDRSESVPACHNQRSASPNELKTYKRTMTGSLSNSRNSETRQTQRCSRNCASKRRSINCERRCKRRNKKRNGGSRRRSISGGPPSAPADEQKGQSRHWKSSRCCFRFRVRMSRANSWSFLSVWCPTDIQELILIELSKDESVVRSRVEEPSNCLFRAFAVMDHP